MGVSASKHEIEFRKKFNDGSENIVCLKLADDTITMAVKYGLIHRNLPGQPFRFTLSAAEVAALVSSMKDDTPLNLTKTGMQLSGCDAGCAGWYSVSLHEHPPPRNQLVPALNLYAVERREITELLEKWLVEEKIASEFPTPNFGL